MSVEAKIRVHEWAPNPERPGYLVLVRTRTVGEVWTDLCTELGEYPDGGEEYLTTMIPRVQEWPAGLIVVFSVNGSSEGDYTHVEVHANDGSSRRTCVMLAKTFMGRDASWAFARRVADLLEIQ